MFDRPLTSDEVGYLFHGPSANAIRSHHEVLPPGGSKGSAAILLPPRHLLIAKYLWPEDRSVAAPDYRVLLYPHVEGDPLPQVEYMDTQISLKIGGSSMSSHWIVIPRVVRGSP